MQVRLLDRRGRDRSRRVLLDGAPLAEATTPVVIAVPGGPHEISLAPPADHQPPCRAINPGGTTPDDPLRVVFIMRPGPDGA